MVATKIVHVNEASEVMWEQPGKKLIGFPTEAAGQTMRLPALMFSDGGGGAAAGCQLSRLA